MKLFSLNNVVCRYDSFACLRREFNNAFRNAYEKGNASLWLIAHVALAAAEKLDHPIDENNEDDMQAVADAFAISYKPTLINVPAGAFSTWRKEFETWFSNAPLQLRYFASSNTTGRK
ncbi:hypothetical protein KCU95_g3153, partial [Aureobasidium melanogenum]